MKTRILAKTKYSKDITIIQLIRPDETRYFKAIICGWNNFKFTSTTMLPQQLFEATLSKCKELAALINEDKTAIERIGNEFSF